MEHKGTAHCSGISEFLLPQMYPLLFLHVVHYLICQRIGAQKPIKAAWGNGCRRYLGAKLTRAGSK
ncbi:unnamed protein product [Musa hybrid cultivar]